MSDSDESDEAAKETVGFAWTSQTCQIRIVIFLFVLSILLGVLTAYIIIPRLREDCKKYHLRRMLSKNKRGLAIPTRNRTSRGGKAGATSKDVTAVSNRFHGLTSKASSSIETRGPSVTTRSPRDDVAADASVLPIDLRPDNGSDSEHVVVILGSDRRPTIGTSTAEVTAVDFINWTTSRELSTFVALEDVYPNVVQNTATGAFRDETAQTFDREENSVSNGNSEENSTKSRSETITAASPTSMPSNVSSLDNNSPGDVFGAEVTSEYYQVSEAQGSNTENVPITTGLGPPAEQNEQPSLADLGGSLSGTGAPTWLDEFFETISSTAQDALSSEQFSVTSFFGDSVTSNISEELAAQAETNGGSYIDTSAPVASSGTATSDDRQEPLYSLLHYSTSHRSYSADFKKHNSPNQTDIPALVITSDMTGDVGRHSRVITAVNGNSDGTTADYEAAFEDGNSVGTASDSNATQLQQDLKSTNMGQDTAHFNDTEGLNRSLTTQQSKSLVSEGETKLSERAETATKTGPGHNTTANVPLTSVVSVGQHGSVMSETYVFNFTEFDMYASSKGNLENASQFCTHCDKTTIETSSPSSAFVPRRISEMASTERSTFLGTAQHTDSEYDIAPSATVSSPSSSLITKLIYDKTPFATEPDDDAEEETVSVARSDVTVRQDNYGEPDAMDADDDDTMIPDGGVREVREALRGNVPFPNTERPLIQERNKSRTIHAKVMQLSRRREARA